MTKTEDFITATWLPLLAERFTSRWPETFVKSTTTDKTIYDAANGSMYKYYINFCNAIYSLGGSAYGLDNKYKDIDSKTHDGTYLRIMFEDFKDAEDWIGWLIEFVPPR